MIKEQNEYKAVKWGFNATTNDFSKLHRFEGKDKFGGHTHTHILNCYQCTKSTENL